MLTEMIREYLRDNTITDEKGKDHYCPDCDGYDSVNYSIHGNEARVTFTYYQFKTGDRVTGATTINMWEMVGFVYNKVKSIKINV